ncbi:MAG: hypothetical protein ACK5LO_00905 [Leucobacter sp.]
MSYQGTLGRIRDSSKVKIMAAWRMYGQGVIDRPTFLHLAEAILGNHGAYAAALADQSVALEVSRLDRRLASTQGVMPTAKLRSYEAALMTILDGDGDLEMKLQRLALNAPLEAAQTTYDHAIEQAGKGWVRQLEADPCQLCRWWWREGQVWPADHPMPTHPGCECIARPVN